jgi:hypothetical protein
MFVSIVSHRRCPFCFRRQTNVQLDYVTDATVMERATLANVEPRVSYSANATVALADDGAADDDGADSSRIYGLIGVGLRDAFELIAWLDVAATLLFLCVARWLAATQASDTCIF